MCLENFKFEGGQKCKVLAHLELVLGTNVMNGAEAIAEIREHNLYFFFNQKLIYLEKVSCWNKRWKERERKGPDALSAWIEPYWNSVEHLDPVIQSQ